MANNDRLLVQILLLVLLGASLWVLAPFWSALFWAAVLSFASWPVMRVLNRLLRGASGFGCRIADADLDGVGGRAIGDAGL